MFEYIRTLEYTNGEEWIMRFRILVLALASVTALGRAVLAQQPDGVGVYTAAQAANGKATFEGKCVECHGRDLRGTAHGPELTGPNFLMRRFPARCARVRHGPAQGRPCWVDLADACAG